MVRGSHGHWVGYVIAPGLVIGVATSLWSIIRGAWGVFVEGQAERRARPKARPILAIGAALFVHDYKMSL
jgi:hypothetical protein